MKIMYTSQLLGYMRPPSKLLQNFVLFVPDPQVKSRAIRLYPGCPSSPIPHSHLDHFLKVCAPHFCLFRFVSIDLLLVSVQSKHRNSLFRYRSETTETKVLFRIVPKLVSVPVSVVSNRNYFRRTPLLPDPYPNPDPPVHMFFSLPDPDLWYTLQKKTTALNQEAFREKFFV
jgi:hypothetical protein